MDERGAMGQPEKSFHRFQKRMAFSKFETLLQYSVLILNPEEREALRALSKDLREEIYGHEKYYRGSLTMAEVIDRFLSMFELIEEYDPNAED